LDFTRGWISIRPLFCPACAYYYDLIPRKDTIKNWAFMLTLKSSAKRRFVAEVDWYNINQTNILKKDKTNPSLKKPTNPKIQIQYQSTSFYLCLAL
jgi:hypothetical protein